MKERDYGIDLDDPQTGGIFHVHPGDLAAMEAAAQAHGLRVYRIALHDCRDEAALLRRLGTLLPEPTPANRGWDALADALRTLGELPEKGCMLLFEGTDRLRSADAASFDTFVGILEETASLWAGEDVPFFVVMTRCAATDEAPQSW